MRLIAVLTAFFCLVNTSAYAQGAGAPAPVADDFTLVDSSSKKNKSAGEEVASENPREDKKEAQRWLADELKNKTRILSLLKKVKDKKSAEKIGASILKEFGEGEGKKTAMGSTGPAKRPSGAIMDECEKKMEGKFRKLNSGIEEQVKRIEELNLESDTMSKALDVVSAGDSSPEAESES